jgi:hypothetical protein
LLDDERWRGASDGSIHAEADPDKRESSYYRRNNSRFPKPLRAKSTEPPATPEMPGLADDPLTTFRAEIWSVREHYQSPCVCRATLDL